MLAGAWARALRTRSLSAASQNSVLQRLPHGGGAGDGANNNASTSSLQLPQGGGRVGLRSDHKTPRRARSIGVTPRSSGACGSAPASSSKATAPIRPHTTASCNGVLPRALATSTKAPAFRNTETSSPLRRAASCRMYSYLPLPSFGGALIQSFGGAPTSNRAEPASPEWSGCYGARVLVLGLKAEGPESGLWRK